MDIIKFSNDRNVKLPLINRKNDPLPLFLNDVFDKYYTNILNFSSLNVSNVRNSFALQHYNNVQQSIMNNLQLIRDLGDSIISAVNKYFEGYPDKAYNKLDSGLLNVRHFIQNLTRDLTTPDVQTKYYRMRNSDKTYYIRDEMFHIPFEKRKNVKMQRYSISGLPCLYLGSSLYICWEELERPRITDIQVCRLIPTDTLRILHFGLPPCHINNTFKKMYIFETFLIYAESFFILWPLFAACSILVNDSEKIFKEEYIIPQLLLQWVTQNKDIDGIRYFSVGINEYPRNSFLYQNYVFPVKPLASTGVPIFKGLCPHLKSKFSITNTLSHQIAKTLNLIDNVIYPNDINDIKNSNNINLRDDSTLELISGVKVNYRDTDFGKMEFLLEGMPTFRL
jgi:hypothetical protein